MIRPDIALIEFTKRSQITSSDMINIHLTSRVV
jgi:hypothetical protein